MDANARGVSSWSSSSSSSSVATKPGVALAAQGPRGPRTTTRTADTAFDYRATRSMVNFYEIFDKEKRAAGRKRLQAEMRKGHFDDFRVLKDTGGKLFVGQRVGAGEQLADVFRGVEVTEAVMNSSDDRSGRVEERTVELLGVAPGTVRLLAVAVRDGAQPMLDAWIDAWVNSNKGGGDCPVVIELSVVDSFVMRLAPFRRMLYSKSGVGVRVGVGVGGRQVFMFTNSVGYDWVMGTFDNRLVGYVYLLDRRGRVRWHGCGFPERDEVDLLIKETERVMREA